MRSGWVVTYTVFWWACKHVVGVPPTAFNARSNCLMIEATNELYHQTMFTPTSTRVFSTRYPQPQAKPHLPGQDPERGRCRTVHGLPDRAMYRIAARWLTN